jgi:ABC-type multidrug transport system fused ATPase/permease subunit
VTVTEAVRSSLRLLNRRDRRLLALAVATQMATSLLDLAGVALLGVVGLLAVSAVKGQPPPAKVVDALSALGVQESNTALIAGTAGVAAVLLITRNVVNPLLMKRILTFLARREASVSARLTRELLSRPLTVIQQRSSQQTASALLDGTYYATSVVLGQAVIIASEATLLTLLVVTLLLINPAVTAVGVAYFAVLAAVLQRVTGKRAQRLGGERRRLQVASLVSVQEAVGAYREITVSDRRMLYAGRIQTLRRESAQTLADLQLIAMLPKYVSEGGLVLGAFALAGILFATKSADVAAGMFAVFLATATRVMPSMLRLQSATLQVRSAAASALSTYQLAGELGHPIDTSPDEPDTDRLRRVLENGHADFVPVVALTDVTFTYPGTDEPALHGVSLSFPAGQTVALVGRSGAGKSTLADVILVVLQPDSGRVTLGGLPPADAVRRWPGGVGYVPQEVLLTNDSIRANVALGLPPEIVDDELVWESLRRAELEAHVRQQPHGLDCVIGERGLRLSGGQRQRLGIARALFSQPRLLTLDEATSSLDAETEHTITTMLDDLHEHVTTVVIAHRLSTVRHADLVVYLQDGAVLATGTFDEVCARIPALRHQAQLMGLHPA